MGIICFILSEPSRAVVLWPFYVNDKRFVYRIRLRQVDERFCIYRVEQALPPTDVGPGPMRERCGLGCTRAICGALINLLLLLQAPTSQGADVAAP